MEPKDTKSKVQTQFGKSAESYVTSQWHAKGKDLAKLVEVANLQGKEKVLDIATGGGHVANALAQGVESAVAYDLTEEILKAAKSFVESNGNDNVEFVQGDAEHLPFDDSVFDVVTCRIAAHHFPNVESFIKESYRVLKKNGQFLLIDNIAPEKEEYDQFYNKVEQDRDYSHHRAWKKSEWMQMLEEAGYEIDETYRFLKTFTFEDWADRMNLSKEKKQELSDYMYEKPEDYHNKFRIKLEKGQVQSFVGESILIKAVKQFEK